MFDKDVVNKKIGVKLKALRDSHNLTLQDIEIITRVELKSVWAYENGKVSIPVSKLTQILSAYPEITIGKFLDEVMEELKEETK